MRNRIITMISLVVLAGFVVQGIFGLAAGFLIGAIGGIIYGILKKDYLFLRWSIVAFIIDVAGITVFYLGLVYSDM